MTIRYHLDENVHGGVATGLRSYGVDVTTSADVGLLGATDAEQLQHCLEFGRTLVTHDEDFCRLHAEGCDHAGIAYCHRQKYSLGQLLQILQLLYDCMAADQIRGTLQFL